MMASLCWILFLRSMCKSSHPKPFPWQTPRRLLFIPSYQPSYVNLLHSIAPSPHGSKSARFPTFRAALLFAQEYGILSASLEDRPFVPIGSVIFGGRYASGVPEGMRRAFRKWEDGGLNGVGRECRVVGLTECLEVVRR